MEKLRFENHIMKQFDEELEQLRTRLMEMGGKVEQQLEMAIRAIADADSKLAEEVIKRDEQVDEMELNIDGACLVIFARRQPAATDLRFVIAVTRAVNDLERVGDEIKQIANHAIQLTQHHSNQKGFIEVRHIGQSVSSMLRDTLDAFARFDAQAAKQIISDDAKIDMDYTTALRELVTYMMEDPRSISRVISILWVIRSLERIGDHAKNLCEQIIFVVEGKDIRHLAR